jgi:hypothetical protein
MWKLHFDNAFKKEMAPKTSPSPVPATTESKVFTQIISTRPPTSNMLIGLATFKALVVDQARSRPVG